MAYGMAHAFEAVLNFDHMPVKYCRMAKRKNSVSKTPEQSQPQGYKVGYARVSTDDQDLALQLEAFRREGIEENRIWTDKSSGRKFDRSGLEQVFAFLDPGDTLVVWRLDRLGRSIKELIDRLEMLQKRGVQFKSLTENIDMSTASGRFVIHVMAAMAEFESQLISERTKAGLAVKIAGGYRPGPEPKLKPHMAKWAQQLRDKGHTAPQIVEKIKKRYKVEITPRTVYLRTKRTQ